MLSVAAVRLVMIRIFVPTNLFEELQSKLEYNKYSFLCFKVIYEQYMFSELLKKENCLQDDSTYNYLNEYFQEYEKENQMEEFLGKIVILLKSFNVAFSSK